MRSLARDEKTVYYAAYIDYTKEDTPIYAGEIDYNYGTPTPISGVLGTVSGGVAPRPYGYQALYERSLLIYDPDCSIDENSILWIDTTPATDGDGLPTVSHDHEVERVMRSSNMTKYILRRVNVNG